MPYKRIITCDACEKELKGGIDRNYLTLRTEGYSQDEKIIDAYFCNLECLRNWVNKEC